MIMAKSSYIRKSPRGRLGGGVALVSVVAVSDGKRMRGRIFTALSVGCLITVLAQIEYKLSVVFTVFWLALALYLAVLHRREARFVGLSFVTVAVAVLLFVYCAACYLVSGEFGYITGFCQLYLKCLLMYIIGFFAFFSCNVSTEKWRMVLAVYVVASCIYMGWAMANYFPGFDSWFSSTMYLFENKNSLGQIVGVAAVSLIVFGYRQKLSSKKVAMWALAGVLVCCILLIQCRAAFLACCTALICLFAIRRQMRILVVLAAVLIVGIALSPDLQAFFSHAFFLDIYKGTDVNAMSSGRLDLWMEALGVSKGHELIGIGSYYVDNMYINLYVNLGIVGFILVMWVWVPRVITNFKYGVKASHGADGYGALGEIVACLTAFYLVESLLEGYPPFGPGACSFVFWMLCGCLDGEESGKTIYLKVQRRIRGQRGVSNEQ